MAKRILTALLSVAMILTVVLFVASCNSDKTETTNSTTSETKTETTQITETTVVTETVVTTENVVTETTAEPNGREKM